MSTPTIKFIVPVASGKGGVGKSTVSANLALALAQMGARVGLMDADVYGPTIPTVLGITQSPELTEQRRIIPVTQHGLKVISMGFFMKPGDAVIWRGPMLHKTIEQFLGTVEWGELDYLLVDTPPALATSRCRSARRFRLPVPSSYQPRRMSRSTSPRERSRCSRSSTHRSWASLKT